MFHGRGIVTLKSNMYTVNCLYVHMKLECGDGKMVWQGCRGSHVVNSGDVHPFVSGFRAKKQEGRGLEGEGRCSVLLDKFSFL